jgi:hypothetical protein
MGTPACTLSDADLMRLKEIDRENRADAARTSAAAAAAASGKGGRRRRRRKGGGGRGAGGAGGARGASGLARSISLYAAENKKLRRVIHEKRPHERPHVIRSHLVEDLFEVERLQAHAVVVMQRAYRRYRRMVDMWEYLRKQRMVLKIQRVMRGAVTREFVRRWYLRKTFLTTLAQACVRRCLARSQWRQQSLLEAICAVDIERIARGYMARLRLERIRRIRAAATVQRVWRGIVGRACADRQWLDQQVTRMQKCCKGHLGREAYQKKLAAAAKSAQNIQRMFRGSEVRQLRNELLYERETRAREMALALLRKEDEYTADVVHLQEKLRDRHNLAGTVKQLDRQLHRMRVDIQGLEFDLEKLQGERSAMSPRAIKQGWKEELDMNKIEYRQRVTALKLETLFAVEQPLRAAEEAQELEQRNLAEAVWTHEQVQVRRHAELVGMWDRESERKWSEEAMVKRRQKAGQKRRWRVKFFTRTGKPDKLRRDGRPWDPRAFAGDEKATFFMGDAKIFSGVQSNPAKLGTAESLQSTVDAVHLQSTMNQFMQYGATLKPLMDNMNVWQDDLTAQDAATKEVRRRAAEDAENARIAALARGESHEAAAAAAAAVAAAAAAEAGGGDGGGWAAGGESKGGTAIVVASPEWKPAQKGKSRKVRNAYASQIPWTLLDELESEKYKLEVERSERLHDWNRPP